MSERLILALETSCDDTCAAVIDSNGRTRANVISSQQVHERFGGVVPEIASRHHLQLVNLIVEQALAQAGVKLDDVGLIAATQGPGLVGALLVGLSSAKALAAARELPFAAVDHLQGHVAANFLDEGFEPPFLCLIASGGHTLLARVSEHEGFEVLGRTLDDAAGEAFDKGARMLGLGYPGGAALERLAVGGGVAANGELRERLTQVGAAVHVPPRVLCTDNAAMIASAARFTSELPYPRYLGLDAYATGERPR
jgi:N6-L-threonylcarbamoyladenine synthase